MVSSTSRRSSQRSRSDRITVLHVDDDPEFADLTAAFLERENDRLSVESAPSVDDGLRRLDDDVDCVVSDYDMPERDGLEFFEAVREEYPDLPFVLFTGKGSEEVASEALSAGVTDYLQKGGGTEQYELLAARAVNAVEKSRAEAARRRHLSAIETVREGIGILSEEMEFVYVNNAYADLFGYDPEEMIGEPWHLVYLDEQIEEVRESVAPTLQEEGYWYEERTFERADGETFLGDHVIALSKTGDGVCIVRDITERRDYERDLAFERDRFQGLFAAIPEPVVEVDVADDGASLRDVNAAFEDTFGYEASEVVGGDLNEVIVPDDECLRTEAEAIDEWAAAGEQLTWEVRRETTDGVRDFLFRSAPIEHDGEVAEQFGLYVDITERKRYERTLEQQNERLEEFTSAVSHDLRGPLSTAEGRLELARADCDSPHLDAVSDAMERMETLIDDLLALAREGVRVREVEPVDLAAVVEECFRCVDAGDAALVVDVDSTVHADRSRLRQLLENLLGNSVEHGSTGSRSQARGNSVEHGSADSRTESDDTIERGFTGEESADGAGRGSLDGGAESTDPIDQEVTITVGELADGDGFYVADDGPGIPPKRREQVFERGYSTAAAGTGFGLAIVGEIADAHGWEVEVLESEDGGARFEVSGVDRAE